MLPDSTSNVDRGKQMRKNVKFSLDDLDGEPISKSKKRLDKKKVLKKKKSTKRKNKDAAYGSDLDLGKEMYPLTHYVKEPQELVTQIFTTLKPAQIKGMLPEVLKRYELSEVQTFCCEQLEVMSKKRVLALLNGVRNEDISSSGTDEDSDQEHAEAPSEQEALSSQPPDSTSPTEIQLEDTLEQVKPHTVALALGSETEPPVDVSKMEILELEMRARAIKKLLEKQMAAADIADIDEEEAASDGDSEQSNEYGENDHPEDSTRSPSPGEVALQPNVKCVNLDQEDNSFPDETHERPANLKERQSVAAEVTTPNTQINQSESCTDGTTIISPSPVKPNPSDLPVSLQNIPPTDESPIDQDSDNEIDIETMDESNVLEDLRQASVGNNEENLETAIELVEFESSNDSEDDSDIESLDESALLASVPNVGVVSQTTSEMVRPTSNSECLGVNLSESLLLGSSTTSTNDHELSDNGMVEVAGDHINQSECGESIVEADSLIVDSSANIESTVMDVSSSYIKVSPSGSVIQLTSNSDEVADNPSETEPNSSGDLTTDTRDVPDQSNDEENVDSDAADEPEGDCVDIYLCPDEVLEEQLNISAEQSNNENAVEKLDLVNSPTQPRASSPSKAAPIQVESNDSSKESSTQLADDVVKLLEKQVKKQHDVERIKKARKPEPKASDSRSIHDKEERGEATKATRSLKVDDQTKRERSPILVQRKSESRNRISDSRKRRSSKSTDRQESRRNRDDSREERESHHQRRYHENRRHSEEREHDYDRTKPSQKYYRDQHYNRTVHRAQPKYRSYSSRIYFANNRNSGHHYQGRGIVDNELVQEFVPRELIERRRTNAFPDFEYTQSRRPQITFDRLVPSTSHHRSLNHHSFSPSFNIRGQQTVGRMHADKEGFRLVRMPARPTELVQDPESEFTVTLSRRALGHLREPSPPIPIWRPARVEVKERPGICYDPNEEIDLTDDVVEVAQRRHSAKRMPKTRASEEVIILSDSD